MSISESEFKSLSKENQFELLNNYGLYAGNRIYYNHRVNLYSLNKFFVEVHYLPKENIIDFIEVIETKDVIKLYSDRINIKFL